jgi:arylsulfatase A-like enzyme
MKSEMKFFKVAIMLVLIVVGYSVSPVMANDTTGAQGSDGYKIISGVSGTPDAKATISGKQIPPPAPPFGGVIKDDALQSKQWWPPRIVPPKGAPNILLILTDDAGFGVPSTFGGVIPTPTMDRIAKNGSALQPHLLHLAVLADARRADHRAQPPLGGLRRDRRAGHRLPRLRQRHRRGQRDHRTHPARQRLRDVWFGKDHNTPTYEASQAGPFNQWPTGMGFDYFYGFVGGDANQWGPNLFRNTTQIYPWIGHEGTLKMDRSDPKAAIWPVTGKESSWNLITAMADDAIAWMDRIHQTDPSSRSSSTTAPAPRTRRTTRPRNGWTRSARCISSTTATRSCASGSSRTKRSSASFRRIRKLTPWPKDILTPWDELSDEAKKLYIRQVEVFAAYVAYSDHEIGRVIQHFEDLGKLDNTLIIYQNGDNGTSAEGGPEGTFSEVAFFNGVKPPVDVQMKFYDAWGTEFAYNHMSAGWSWAFDTPFDWFKQNASRLGGINQNMVISWPARIKDKGGLREQFMHVIDHVPTILEVTGIAAPEVVDGIKQKPIEGTSYAYTFDASQRQGTVPAHHPVFRDDGPVGALPRRLAAEHQGGPRALGCLLRGQPGPAEQPGVPALRPDHQLEPVRRHRRAASGEGRGDAQDVPRGSQEVSGLPAGCLGGRPGRAPRPSLTAGRNEYVYTRPMTGLPQGDAPVPAQHLLHHHGGHHRARGRRRGHDRDLGRAFRRIRLLPARGQAGVPVEPARPRAHQVGRTGGARARSAQHRVRLQVRRPRRGNDGLQQLQRHRPFRHRHAEGRRQGGANHQDGEDDPIILQWDESFDIGSDTITGVNDADYLPPFPLTAELDKLTIKVDRPQLSPEEIKKLEAGLKKGHPLWRLFSGQRTSAIQHLF